MISIDFSIGNIICIQIPMNEREETIKLLNNLLANGNQLEITSVGGKLIFVISDNEFKFDATHMDELVLTMRMADCIEIIEAIQEHLAEEPGFPLDHSLQSFGARMIPETLKDVVIETI